MDGNKYSTGDKLNLIFLDSLTLILLYKQIIISKVITI